MPKAKKVAVPNELKVLLPSENVVTVVIADDAYEMAPLNEGLLEKITSDLAKIYDVVYNPDRKCPKCGKLYKKAVIRDIEFCTEKDCSNEPLEDCRKGQIDAILGSGKIPEWIEMILGVPKDEVTEKMTFQQMRHFSACFWKINFSDEGLPTETSENFQKLLAMIGMPQPPGESKATTPSTK